MALNAPPGGSGNKIQARLEEKTITLDPPEGGWKMKKSFYRWSRELDLVGFGLVKLRGGRGGLADVERVDPKEAGRWKWG